MSLCQRNLECMSNCRLIDCQVRLAIIKAGVTEYGLHRLNIACCRQYLGRQGAPAAVRRSLLDTSLPVEPANGLLERITGLVNLWPTVKLAVLERQFKGLALVCSDQL